LHPQAQKKKKKKIGATTTKPLAAERQTPVVA
jgi:hypothetical protein